jgi:hypothetical protein
MQNVMQEKANNAETFWDRCLQRKVSMKYHAVGKQSSFRFYPFFLRHILHGGLSENDFHFVSKIFDSVSKNLHLVSIFKFRYLKKI